MGSLLSRNVVPIPSSSNIFQRNHVVFVSHICEDAPYKFPSHLYAALNRLDIKTCMAYEIRTMDEIWTAIEGAKVSIIIFSETYASSKLCLDQLEKIIECMSRIGQIIIPIFRDVDPSHVRNQTGTFGEGFAENEQNFMDDMNKVLRWKQSLETVASISGWDCSFHRLESELVEKIAHDVLQKLDSVDGGEINNWIRMLKPMAQEKYNKYLSTNSLSDLEDFINTLQQLIRHKTEKVLKTNEESHWDDLNETYERILEFKKEKYNTTGDEIDRNDLEATQRHFSRLKREKECRMKRIPNGI